MKTLEKYLLFFILCINVVGAQSATPKQPKCVDRGGHSDVVCNVSMFELLAFPEKYDNVIVEVQGYFVSGSVSLLFVDEGAARTSRTVDSIAVNVGEKRSNLLSHLLVERNRNDLVLFGRFSAKVTSVADIGGGIVSGSIEATEAARPVGPWGVKTEMPKPKE